MVRMLVTTACITVIRHAHLLKREMTPHALAHRRPCGALAALTNIPPAEAEDRYYAMLDERPMAA
jgi:hypothetical protein